MKSYDEIANNIFKRRDEYIAKQKKKKRITINTISVIVCCCVFSTIGFGLHKSGIFSDKIPMADSSNNSADTSYNEFFENNHLKDSSNVTSPKESKPNDTHSQDGYSSNNDSSSKPTHNNSDSSQGGFVPGNTPSKPIDNTPSNSTSSNPPITETNYFIDSIDKINFYSAKKIINENSLLPISMNNKNLSMPEVVFLNNNYAEYPIDRNKIFTTTMVTYFTLELNDERGFLAQKLGGTGLIEVVVTQNNIDDLGQMITFKREEKYYTCFANGGDYDPDSNKSSSEFSSHKYIDGFNVVKNKEQENYKFIVHYEGSKVVGFECAPFESTPTNYNTDDITFIEDYCVVLFTKKYFTIDQLEVFFKNEAKGDLL